MVTETSKPAYKQSETGIIPEDWNEFTLDSLCKSFTKQTGFDYSAYIKPKLVTTFKKGTIPFIQNKDFYAKNTNFNTDYYIPEEIANLFPRILLDEICLLISISGSIGNVGIFSNVQKAFIGGAVAVAKFRNKKQLDWVMYYLLSNAGQNAFLKQVKAGAQHNLILDDLRKITIPFPSEDEQQVITQILSETDELLQQIDKLIEKKKKIKQGAMQELLTGKKRLSGFGDDWEVKKLGNILQSTQLGGNYQNSEEPTEYPLIKMGNINRGYIELSKIEYIKKDDEPSQTDKLHYGDVLFNTRNTLDLVGKVAIWKNELPLAYFNSNLMRLHFKEDEVSSNFFMNFLFNTKSLLTQLKNIATGTTSVAAIYNRDLIDVEIKLPIREEQLAIAGLLSDMDAEIEAFNKKRDKYRQLKVGMMQQLLTGRIRLKCKN